MTIGETRTRLVRPPEHEAVRAKSFHPSGYWVELSSRQLASTLHGVFEEVVERFPDNVAVRSATAEVTYEQLNGRANQIARTIIQRVGSDVGCVPLLFEQGAALCAPLWAALKSGGFIMPMDPQFPPHVLKDMVLDSTAKLILTNSRNEQLAQQVIPDGGQVINVDNIDPLVSWDNLDVPVANDDLVYMFYTSGSTGKPKGVVHTHKGWLKSHVIHDRAMHISSEDSMTLVTSVSGQAIANIFMAHIGGAMLCPIDVRHEGVAPLADWIRRNDVTVTWLPSPLYRSLMETLADDEVLPSVRLVRISSQTAYPSDLEAFKRHFADHAVLGNALSSTESGLSANFLMDKSTVLDTPTIPVGYIEDEEWDVQIVGDDGVEVPPGEVGEIVVSHDYLSPGYWNQPELTAAAFLVRPDGSREYHTGDLGRKDADGRLEHLGRKDNQIKIRGNRVETTAIEAALMDYQGVKAAVVIVKEDSIGNRRLAAYVVASTDTELSQTDLRQHLADRLPSPAIPSYIIQLDELPMLAGGKIDRLALPDPTGARPDQDTKYAGPRDRLEARLCQVWSAVLAVDKVGIHDDFLDLGGDSLLAASLIAQIKQVLGQDISLSALIEANTVANMADVLRSEDLAPQLASLVPIQTKGNRPPLFFVHPLGGNAFCFIGLARSMGENQPFYGLEAPGRNGEQAPLNRIEKFATRYVREIREVQPHGPYHLGGHSLGGRIAMEMARQLQAKGEEVALLAVLDSNYPDARVGFLERLNTRLKLRTRLRALRGSEAAKRSLSRSMLTAAFYDAVNAYNPTPYDGRIVYFKSMDWDKPEIDRRDEWHKLALQGIEVHEVPGDHDTMLVHPNVQTLAASLKTCLEASRGSSPL